ncbi:hypothetical protein ABH973_000068 [Bradyrhizobium ottawaense]|uniref:hypothetical protein n=1 Tax=Bradyrhizobium ottawaense TaxID=931866 RepID=UPI003518A955
MKLFTLAGSLLAYNINVPLWDAHPGMDELGEAGGAAMKRHAMSKYFGNGAGHVLRQHNSAVLQFSWGGRPDGSARYIERVNRYTRDGVEYSSLAALLRAVEDEHAQTQPQERSSGE